MDAVRVPWSEVVYPRVYGGTGSGAQAARRCNGLSPRVRGNRPPCSTAYGMYRSIPACTGEPACAIAARRPPRVYPRVYGGTRSAGAQWSRLSGLSPRVRGNRTGSPLRLRRCGSIPACTGEPWRGMAFMRRAPVYPRVYGGTRQAQGFLDAYQGLSPRVRGNRRHRPALDAASRSIPACTGEPRLYLRMRRPFRVYPRVYGGTSPDGRRGRRAPGLSPRVRGNLQRAAERRLGAGSIPACTGEPFPAGRTVPVPAVYPRVYGGTGRPSRHRTACRGLSPRVRGNLLWPPAT